MKKFGRKIRERDMGKKKLDCFPLKLHIWTIVCFQSKARIGSSFCREKNFQREDLKRAILVVADVVCWILSTVQISSCIKTVLLNWKSVKRCSIKAHPKYVYRKCERKRWYRFGFFLSSFSIYFILFYLHWTSE